MNSEETEGSLFIPPLPVVKRETIERALISLNEQNLVNARHSKLPLFAWLAQHDMAFFFGGALCRYVLEREAQSKILAQVTRKTMNGFMRELKRREREFLRLDITDIQQVPADLAPSFATWKPENSELMDFLAYDMPKRLAIGGYTPREIGSAQAGALLTYEISRRQVSTQT